MSFLVNNAGWDRAANFLDTTPEFWRKVVAINLYGPLNVSHVVLKGMAARGFGRVVNIASDAGRVGSSGEAVYSACKGGMIAFSKTLARELVSKGVIVNTLCPGPTDTAILRSFLEGPDGAKIAEGLKRAIPMRRLRRARGLSGARRLPALRRCRLHHRPDHQRLGRPHHARMNGWTQYQRSFCLTCATAWRRITINRPEKYNAVHGADLRGADRLRFSRAGWDKSVAVIVLGGAGDRAFCTGADQSAHRAPTSGRGTHRRCRSTNCSR